MIITVIQVNNNIIGITNRLKQIKEQIQKVGETDFVGKGKSLSAECDVKSRKRTQDITFYGDWIDE